ncbi:MAG TPA: hypothetical protein VJT49_07270 [Amycolatopsis sp.]|uniref:hypothetical protein n=1 Tax=Amycolatopsis sp. TaxID=37632 RepID=UPI002B47DBCB|nr:hypothetical protein [Amycolatopsis sp.]HKS44907.1 hypothetical protein [Amycolatopsis sp.]
MSRGEWRSLAPIQRVLPEHPLVNPAQRFSSSLATWQSPAYLAPLGHRVSVNEPSGTADLARPVTVSRAVAMPVAQPLKTSKPPRVPLLSRIRDAVLQRSAEEAVSPEPPETTSFEPAPEVVSVEPAVPVSDGPALDPAPNATLGQPPSPALPQVQRVVENPRQVPVSPESAGRPPALGVQRAADPLPSAGPSGRPPVAIRNTLDGPVPGHARGPAEVQRVAETLPTPGARETRSDQLPLVRLRSVQPVQRTTDFTRAGPVELPMLRLPSVAAPVVARTAEPSHAEVGPDADSAHVQSVRPDPVQPVSTMDLGAAHVDTVGTVGAADSGALDVGAAEVGTAGTGAVGPVVAGDAVSAFTPGNGSNAEGAFSAGDAGGAMGVGASPADLPAVQRAPASQDVGILPLRPVPAPQFGDNSPSIGDVEPGGGRGISRADEPSLPLAGGTPPGGEASVAVPGAGGLDIGVPGTREASAGAVNVGDPGADRPAAGSGAAGAGDGGFVVPTLSRLADPAPAADPAPEPGPATPTLGALNVATPAGLNVQRHQEPAAPAPDLPVSVPVSSGPNSADTPAGPDIPDSADSTNSTNSTNSLGTVDSGGGPTLGVSDGGGITALAAPVSTGQDQETVPEGSNAQVQGALNAPVVSEHGIQAGLGVPAVQRAIEGRNATGESSAPLLGGQEPSTSDSAARAGSGSSPAPGGVSRTVDGHPPVVQRAGAASPRRLGLGSPLIPGSPPGLAPMSTPPMSVAEPVLEPAAISATAPLTGEAPLEAPPPPETVQRQEETAAPGEALPIAALPVARALDGPPAVGRAAFPAAVPVTVSRLIGDRAAQPVLATTREGAHQQGLASENVRPGTAPSVQELVPPPAQRAPAPPTVQTVVQGTVPVMAGPVEVTVQREDTGAAPAAVGAPPPADATESAALAAPPPSAAAAPAPGQSPDELVKKLFDPLLRLLKTELRLDRERRGALTDRWH